jgi:hypothetical protein
VKFWNGQDILIAFPERLNFLMAKGERINSGVRTTTYDVFIWSLLSWSWQAGHIMMIKYFMLWKNPCPRIAYIFYYFINSDYALWPVPIRNLFLDILVRFLRREISPTQGLYLHRTTQHRKTRTQIPASSGFRTHNPSVQAVKDRTCLRPSAIGTCLFDYLKII